MDPKTDSTSRAAANSRLRIGAPSSTHLAVGALRIGPFLVLISMWAALGLASGVFLTTQNLTNLTSASMVVSALAIGQLIVLVTGQIDLSQGSAIALATVVGAKLSDGGAASPLLVIGGMLCVGAAIGLVNGLLIERLRISSFIVTLGMASAASGFAYIVSDGATIVGMPQFVQTLGADDIGAVPVSAIAVAVLAMIVAFIASQVRWGRWFYAVGGNRQSAARQGMPVSAVAVSAMVISGITAGVAAVLIAGVTNSGYPTAGNLSELDAISAVVIGGASLAGGRGTVLGALIGAFTLGTLHNGLNLLDVNPNWQPVALGTVLVSAVGLDNLRRHLEKRLRIAESASSEGDGDPQASAEDDRREPSLVAIGTPSADPSDGDMAGAPVLELRGVSKRYGAVKAVQDVSLSLGRGEVLALLGDNGAGKSTLIKCVTGADHFDDGEVLLNGEPVQIKSAKEGQRHGIEAVYQDLALFDNIDVVGNFYAGRELVRPSLLGSAGVMRKRVMDRTVADALVRLQVRVRNRKNQVGLMSGGQRQAIAVGRAVAFARNIVILDEPTAALGMRESRNVLDLVRRLPEHGISVILISHNLDDVIAVADRVVVMCQGVKVGEAVPTESSREHMVSLIVRGGAVAAAPQAVET